MAITRIVGHFKDGTLMTADTGELIARAFGFTSLHDMEQTCAHADERRAFYKRRTA